MCGVRRVDTDLKRRVGLGMGLGVRPLLLTRIWSEGEKHCCSHDSAEERRRGQGNSAENTRRSHIEAAAHLFPDPPGRRRGRRHGDEVDAFWRRRRRLLQVVVALRTQWGHTHLNIALDLGTSSKHAR